jgi:hypothetical protein
MNTTRRFAVAVGLLGTLAGCDNGTTSAPLPIYQAPMVDAGSFVTGTDAHADAPDGSSPPDATADAGSDALAAEAGADATKDAAVESATDGATQPDATDASTATDSAEPPCSVDAGTCVPVCMSDAGVTEGWYFANGTLICAAACAGDTAKCQHVGQVGSQGWYTMGGGGCPPHATEILNDPTCQP